jgi:hypothetical protein
MSYLREFPEANMQDFLYASNPSLTDAEYAKKYPDYLSTSFDIGEQGQVTVDQSKA